MASNIRKESRKQGNEKDGSKRSMYELFKMLLLLVFQGENLFRFLASDKGETACSKNSYYRFLEDCHANWNRFVMLLAARVITYFSGLTRPERVKIFVLDDSVIPRERSKKTELLSHVYGEAFQMKKKQKSKEYVTRNWIHIMIVLNIE